MRYIGPPPEPYWTDKMVEAYLKDAAKAMRALPAVKVQGYFSTWPDTPDETWFKAEGSTDKPRFRPTPRQIDQAFYVMEWLRWPSMMERKIMWDRANRVPWKVMEHTYQSARSTLWRHHAHGVMWVMARLNQIDPEGEMIKKFR